MITTSNRREQSHFDWQLLVPVYGLAIFGIFAIAIATFDPDLGTDLSPLNYIINSYNSRWQAIFCLVSPVVIAVVMAVPYEVYRINARLLYIASIGLLAVVLGIAEATRGVTGWINIFSGRQLQPSEFAKLGIILMFARTLSIAEKPMRTVREFIRGCLIYIIPAGLTFVQGETGTVIVMTFVFLVMMLFGGVDMRAWWAIVIAGVLAVGTLAAYLYVTGSTDYRWLRIISFIDPQLYKQSAGYQILNSQMAIGSGGMEGIGTFIPGAISQLNYVPEDHTDFIFSAIGEAFGFRVCIAIVAAYLFMLLRMLYLAWFTKDKFGRMVIIGVMAMMFVHVFENLAMTLGLMPITGIPLPFLSSGGSNFITNMIGIALVLNVTKNRTEAQSLNMPLPMPVRRRGGRRRARSAHVGMD